MYVYICVSMCVCMCMCVCTCVCGVYHWHKVTMWSTFENRCLPRPRTRTFASWCPSQSTARCTCKQLCCNVYIYILCVCVCIHNYFLSDGPVQSGNIFFFAYIYFAYMYYNALVTDKHNMSATHKHNISVFAYTND